jgi:hypothetical protein
MTEEKDAREFTRVTTQVWAVIRGADGGAMEGLIRDVSANGLFVSCPEIVETNVSLDVEVHLGAFGAAISGRASVVRQADDGVALQFEMLNGVESFEHLRRLILMNTHDAERAEDEFESHLGLRLRDPRKRGQEQQNG